MSSESVSPTTTAAPSHTNVTMTAATSPRSRVRQREEPELETKQCSTSIMKDRIRQDFLDAVFGPSFFPIEENKNAKNQMEENATDTEDTIQDDNNINTTATTTNNYEPPRQGVGLAGIPHYVTYASEIPPPPQPLYANMPLEQSRDPKLGLTLTRLSLGLFVSHVVPESEAALAGVQVGSILVSINHGMNLLVEPSRHALERLWQYEGLFSYCDNGNNNCGNGDPPTRHDSPADQPSSSSSSCQSHRPPMQDPIALTFYLKGQLYTCHLLSNPPFWGIQWDSCADVCLVNRAYSYASSIGKVRRGSIVASVNGHSLRQTSYQEMGQLITQLYQERSTPIKLWLCFPPAAGRSGYWERQQQQQQQSNSQQAENADEALNTSGDNLVNVNGNKLRPHHHRKGVVRTVDGVEIRVRSVGDSWQALFKKGNNNNNGQQKPRGKPISAASRLKQQQQQQRGKTNETGPIGRVLSTLTLSSKSQSNLLLRSNPPDDNSENDLNGSVADVARRVVDGEIIAPATSLEAMAQNAHWSPQQRCYRACPTLSTATLLQQWDPLQAFLYCLLCHRQMQCIDVDSGGSMIVNSMPTFALMPQTETCQLLKQLATDDLMQTFLWQFLSLIGYCQSNKATSVGGVNGHGNDTAEEATIQDSSSNNNLQNNRSGGDPYMEEKKEDGPPSLEQPIAPQPHAGELITATPAPAARAMNCNTTDLTIVGEIVTSRLLKLSRKDSEFCQRLYFCLRSTIQCLESAESMNKENSKTTDGKSSVQKPAPHNHLLALFNCLQLLRSAEREAADSSNLGSQMSVEQQWRSSRELKSSVTSSASTTPKPLVLPPKVSVSVPSGTLGSVDDMSEMAGSTQAQSKRNLFGIFRKNKSKNKKHPSSAGSVVSASETSNTMAAATPPEAPKSPAKKPPTQVRGSSALSPRRLLSHHPRHSSSNSLSALAQPQPPKPLLENLSGFVKELDGICSSIEKRLLKSISQKIADWALQPWSASKSTVLQTVTEGMRQSLAIHGGTVAGGRGARRRSHSSSSLHKQMKTSLLEASSSDAVSFCLSNPLTPSELLVGIVPNECYILPSAHFPILLTFDAMERQRPATPVSARQLADSVPRQKISPERSYRVTVEICNFTSSSSRLVLHGAVGGMVQESVSNMSGKSQHVFRKKLQFDIRSSWGAPRTLSLRLATIPDDDEDSAASNSDGGFGWIDLVPHWDRLDRFQEPSSYCTTKIYSTSDYGFDEQGQLMFISSKKERLRPIRLQFKVTTEIVGEKNKVISPQQRKHKRMLLYKHGDDLRQEAFAIQFVKTCDTLLKASGLDLKLLTFGCIPVGANRGFVEWVHGSVPLSDICQKPFSSIFGTPTANVATTSSEDDADESSTSTATGDNHDDGDNMSVVAKGGVTNYESIYRMSIAGMGNVAANAVKSTRTVNRFQQQLGPRGSLANNPIQDFLRSIAFDPNAPYFVDQNVMDTYVKSCAGYCVITYILGVGDRHLDNLLLHNRTGSFFHCDYSFLFGKDPKKYLPMRVTEDMIHGMGGSDSDNYAKFLSLVGSAFLTLRRPENVRFLLSLLRVMEASRLPDIVSSASPEHSGSGASSGNGNDGLGVVEAEDPLGIGETIMGMRSRLRLDLTEDEAVAFMEEMIESSVSSKIWMAVDAIHSLGKRF